MTFVMHVTSSCLDARDLMTVVISVESLGRAGTGTEDFKFGDLKLSGESLRHLGAPGIFDANKQDFHKEGAEGRNRTADAGLFRAALYP